MYITSKGQVTIPMEIRNQFGLLPHTKVRFIISHGQIILKKEDPIQGDQHNRGKHLIQHLRARGNVQLSTDEIMQLTRGK
ncbi:MAG: AbrB/MazE/SpoVT family DNA-binding domain-containing protein [Gammaproteobacteria bacterium]